MKNATQKTQAFLSNKLQVDLVVSASLQPTVLLPSLVLFYLVIAKLVTIRGVQIQAGDKTCAS